MLLTVAVMHSTHYSVILLAQACSDTHVHAELFINCGMLLVITVEPACVLVIQIVSQPHHL